LKGETKRLGWLWENKEQKDNAQQSKPAAGIIKNGTAMSSDSLLKQQHAERTQINTNTQN
jgi:hypothetical protein